MQPTFAEHGAQRAQGAAREALADLEGVLCRFPVERAGTRIFDVPELRHHMSVSGALGRVAATLLGGAARPVRAVLFNKSADTNWSLAWHQDRTICVRQRIEVDGFGPWTVKRSVQHVAPPFDLLARMVTLRVHLDPVPETNAPLLIAPGSHRLGRVAVAEVGDAVRRCGQYACLADVGDIWAYATPVLHASDAALLPASRRVLQIDYSAADLPGCLEWLGI